MTRSHPVGIAFAGVAFAICAAALTVSGQSGWQTLVFVEAEFDGSGPVDGLAGAYSVTVSPDGRHLYSTGVDDDAVAVFSRNPTTGELTWVEVEKDDVGGVDRLAAPASVAVSPDNNNVYVASAEEDSVVVFSRNSTTGGLSWVEEEYQGTGGVDGLDAAWSVAVSPDGKNVYAAGYFSDAVVVFTRDQANGSLTFKNSVKDDEDGVSGLDGPRCVVVSPDGKHVYAAGSSDGTVAAFSRNPADGGLSFVEFEQDGSGGVDGLGGSISVAISPDGNHVYVAGSSDSAVAVFARNPTTGELTFQEAKFDDVSGVDGLEGTNAVAVSPDGSHVFASGHTEHEMAVFNRNPTTGKLSWVEVVRDGLGSVDGLSGPQGVAASPDGNHVYVAGSSDDAVAAFESWGSAPREEPPAFIMNWGSQGSGTGEFRYPYGVAAGSVYVADTQNHRIQKFDDSGNFLTEWGSQGSGNGFFEGPADVATDALGQVFVVDKGNDRIQAFDSDGNYLRKWGSSGSTTGQFSSPQAIAVGEFSIVYVADTGNHRIQKFTDNGTFLKEWGSSGTGPGEFVLAGGIAVGPGGDVYVADYAILLEPHHRVQRFDGDGLLLASWGAGPGSHNGRLSLPHRLAVDREGDVYVSDLLNHRIQKFDGDGNFLVAWGTSGSGDGQFKSPSAVAVDSMGRIYVADKDNHRIQVFGGPYLDFFIGETPVTDRTLWLSPPSLSTPGPPR